MKCANCEHNDGMIYTSMPPKYRCTITNEFHFGDNDCNAERRTTMPIYRNNEVMADTCNTQVRTVSDELYDQRENARIANELAMKIEKYICGFSDKEPVNKRAVDSLASAIGENTDIMSEVISSLRHILGSIGISEDC